MANILNQDFQRFLGGAAAIANIEVEAGETFPVTIQATFLGVARNLIGHTLETDVDLVTAEATSSGKIAALAPVTGGTAQTWDIAVVSEAAGTFQILIPANFAANAAPGADDIPGAVCHVRLIDGNNLVKEMRLVVVQRHGSGEAAPGAVALPVAGDPVLFRWETSIAGETVQAVTQATLHSIVVQEIEGEFFRLLDEATQGNTETGITVGVRVADKKIDFVVTGGGTPTPTPSTYTVRMGISADAMPAAAAFTVMGDNGDPLVVPDIATGERRYVVVAKPESEGDFDYIRYYNSGHRDDTNRLGTAFVAGAGTIDIGGTAHNWARSRVALGDSASGRIIEAG